MPRLVGAAVVTDVDGTLVRRGQAVSQHVREAVESLVDRGVHMIFASGRPHAALRDMVSDLAPSADVAASNGNFLVRAGKPGLVYRTFNEANIHTALDLARECGATAVFHSIDGSNVVCAADAGALRVLRMYGEPTPEVVGREQIVSQVDKVVHIHLIRPGSWRTNVVVSGMVAQASEPEYVTLTPLGVDKGSGTATLLAHYVLPPGRLFVLGDGANDLPLFALCGATRFAVGTKNAMLVAQADYIAPGIDRDGFWWAVKHAIIPALDGEDGS